MDTSIENYYRSVHLIIFLLLAVIAGEFIICTRGLSMTVPARPTAFFDPFMAALHWFAVHYPNVTNNWSAFCDELILQEDDEHNKRDLPPRWNCGDRMLPSNVVMGYIKKKFKVDILRYYGREQLRHLSTRKTKESTLKKRYGPDYNPFNTLLQSNPMINAFLLSTIATTPESIISPTLPPLPTISSPTSTDMPGKSPKKSPQPHKGGVQFAEMSSMAAALFNAGIQFQEVDDESYDKFYNITQNGTYDFDGIVVQVFDGFSATNCGTGKERATRIKLQLAQNQINNRTKVVSTCIMFSLCTSYANVLFLFHASFKVYNSSSCRLLW